MKALVTGAAAGLGSALVQQLLSAGGTVVAIDRDELPGGDRLVPLVADLSDPRDLFGVLGHGNDPLRGPHRPAAAA